MNLSVADLTLDMGATIKEALVSIEQSAQGVVFLVDGANKIRGVLTDGDIRRALLRGVTLVEPVQPFMTKTFVRARFDTPQAQIVQLFREGITHIPLVDDDDYLMDFASTFRLRHLPVMEPYLNGNELAYVAECIQTKWISSQGRFVSLFEKMFAEMHGRYAVTVSNGTTALHLALLALDIGPGDEVILPDLTFAATINTVLHAGATPVIVDVEQNTWTISPDEIRRAITPRTKAIMPVHLYGQPAAMAEIMAIAHEYGLLVVEDAAESLGATSHGQLTGTFGDASCFSFFGNKIVTTGEGGMVLFKCAEKAARARLLRDHGMSKDRRYWHVEVGYNYRMTNLQAAVGVAQMENFPDIISRKLKIAAAYRTSLESLPWLEMPPDVPGDQSVYWLFTVLLTANSLVTRDEVMRSLEANGIETRPVFYALHTMPIYSQYLGNRSAPCSLDISSRGFSMPSSALVSIEDVAQIRNLLRAAAENKRLSSYASYGSKESIL